jgi:hypothetical protein
LKIDHKQQSKFQKTNLYTIFEPIFIIYNKKWLNILTLLKLYGKVIISFINEVEKLSVLMKTYIIILKYYKSIIKTIWKMYNIFIKNYRFMLIQYSISKWLSFDI